MPLQIAIVGISYDGDGYVTFDTVAFNQDPDAVNSIIGQLDMYEQDYTPTMPAAASSNQTTAPKG